jgi:hypothetical protein
MCGIRLLHINSLGIDGSGDIKPRQSIWDALFLATIGIMLAENFSNNPPCQ